MTSRIADGDRPKDPGELTPERALERFMRRRQTDVTNRTLRSYRSRLQPFIEFCEEEEIEQIGNVTPFLIDEYDLQLCGRELAPTTIKGHLTTLRVFLSYCEGIGVVDDGVADSVSPPSLDAHEEKSEERLAAEDAMAALQFFRESRSHFGVPMHAFLEVAWYTGARMGSLRGLDLDDYDADEQFVAFRHRAPATPLKNKQQGERLVGLADSVCEALETYIARERSDKRDEFGRRPLFCGRQGRASFSTLRAWSYQAPRPCLWTECPHGKRSPTCTWTEHGEASKCPLSRSPHRVRTGSITWQLNRGFDIETVPTRVNAAPSTIRRYYDATTQQEEFEQRRQDVEIILDNSQADDNDESV